MSVSLHSKRVHFAFNRHSFLTHLTAPNRGYLCHIDQAQWKVPRFIHDAGKHCFGIIQLAKISSSAVSLTVRFSHLVVARRHLFNGITVHADLSPLHYPSPNHHLASVQLEKCTDFVFVLTIAFYPSNASIRLRFNTRLYRATMPMLRCNSFVPALTLPLSQSSAKSSVDSIG